MQRTEIELTEWERTSISTIARQRGKTEGEAIHEAIERFLGEPGQGDRRSLLRQARGIWQDRDDLPDFGQLRREFDREA